ncbi:MAG: DUF4962 domain-containing protein [Bacteroidaceae bacterium]
MKKPILFLLACLCSLAAAAQATLHLTERTLMHEMRETPSPLDKAVVADRSVSLQWPLEAGVSVRGAILDGLGETAPKTDKRTLKYQVRYSTDRKMKKNVTTVTTSYPFHNPEQPLKAGRWYWQYGYVKADGTHWSDLLCFSVEDSPAKFCPPAYPQLIARLPQSHPRILVDGADWDGFIARSKAKPERAWYLERAEKILKKPMSRVEDIDFSQVAGLDNEVKRKALMTRESRRIVDREEGNTDVLIRAYLLTRDRRFMDEAMHRIEEMITWDETGLLHGDFNESVLLSLPSMAYDAFYDHLTDAQKARLLSKVRENGTKFFNRNSNHLENHIADNHTWQMTLRILTMAAFATYGELPEAAVWTDYCYNIWLARFPGLNKDGAWHNGDSYFGVNFRTLIEVPYFYGRLTGFDFFADPWYRGNALYVIYEQPPFSKSGGNGSSHQNILQPSGTRVGYADALARLTGDTYAADYVRRILARQPNLLKEKGFGGKSGDLSWFRLQCDKPLPEGPGLTALPAGHVFPQSGLAAYQSDWNDPRHNAMLAFRSSPYGSTSHALANQNAFNTFYAGKPLFYSSGHHVSFTDQHSIYCHRASRAHNTILANGMGQRIGTEGYGWIPRHYESEQLNYVVGDASNAYGEVISSLWLERGKASELEYTPANGWDKNHVKTFRRHIVTLGKSDLVFIYDELEADTAIAWNYLLHTIAEPMQVDRQTEAVCITATNGPGQSDAYLYAPDALQTDTTSRFFYPAVNWLRADDKGVFKPYPNHWHFTATSKPHAVYRFATLISTHDRKQAGIVPQRLADGSIQAGDWNIRANLTTEGKASFTVTNKREGIVLEYDDKTVVRTPQGKTVLKDEVPELEI